MYRFPRHVPNVLTVARLCSLPVIVWTYSSMRGARNNAWIVLFAALSDVADGFVAGVTRSSSDAGWNPIVDRLFFFIVAMLWSFGTLPWWAVLSLLIRDGIILVLALPVRRFTEAKPEVSRWGKASNFILICALDLRVLGWSFFTVGGSMYVATGTAIARSRGGAGTPRPGLACDAGAGRTHASPRGL